MKVIAVANQKGGCAKTVTALALAGGIAVKGRTLLIDLDGQCDATSVYMPDAEPRHTILDLLTGKCTIDQAIEHTKIGDIIPSTTALSDSALKDITTLKAAVKGLNSSNYDYVIIDTPPNAGKLMATGLVAADYVLIPTKASKFGLDAFYQFMDSLVAVKGKNPDIKVLAVLPTLHQARSVLFREYLGALKKAAAEYGIPILEPIRNSCTIEEAADQNLCIFDYQPKSPVAEDYRTAIIEIKELL